MFTVGLLAGFAAGCALYRYWVAAPAARAARVREYRLLDRVGAWHRMATMTAYATRERDDLGDALDAIYGDNDRHSRKALRAVQ